MTRRLRSATALATLCAFTALAVAPRLAAADEIAPTQPPLTLLDHALDAGPLYAQYQPPPPGYYQQQPPPGYYQQQPPPGYYQQQPPPGYYQPQPAYVVPMQRRVVVGYESRPRWGLFAAGLSMFAGAYLLTLAAALPYGENEMAAPVIGPVLGWRNDDAWAGLNTLMLLDTMVQAAGVTMLIVGLAAKKRVPIYQTVAVTPVVTPSYAGLGAVGRF